MRSEEGSLENVFCLEWQKDIMADLITYKDPKVHLTDSDLECTGLVLLLLVIEAVLPLETLNVAHVTLFNDNQIIMRWVEQIIAQGSLVAD